MSLHVLCTCLVCSVSCVSCWHTCGEHDSCGQWPGLICFEIHLPCFRFQRMYFVNVHCFQDWVKGEIRSRYEQIHVLSWHLYSQYWIKQTWISLQQASISLQLGLVLIHCLVEHSNGCRKEPRQADVVDQVEEADFSWGEIRWYQIIQGFNIKTKANSNYLYCIILQL